jgi:hypothetical protein
LDSPPCENCPFSSVWKRRDSAGPRFDADLDGMLGLSEEDAPVFDDDKAFDPADET